LTQFVFLIIIPVWASRRGSVPVIPGHGSPEDKNETAMRIATQHQNDEEQERSVRPWARGSRAAGNLVKSCGYIALVAAVTLGTAFRSMADVPLVYDVENTGTNCPAPPLPTFGNLPFVVPLPDPFLWADGSGRSTNFADWECHRAQIKAQIENYEIGPKPAVDPQSVTASCSNGVLTVNVTVGVNTLTLTCPVILPPGSGPFPAVIGMNSPSGSIPSSLFTSRDIAQITFYHNQVTTYGNQQNTDPYYRLYGPALNNNNTGQYSAWAWGVSRIIDGLQLVTNTLPIDLKHICVTGCSYAGKMALFSGAFDERIALTIAQESGGGGATSWRYSHTEPAGSVESLENTDHNWFMESMFQFGGNNVSYLPEDHHELMAMCAPRALFVTGNPDYTWLSNPSCYVCSRAAQQIYNTLGISDRFGFSIVGGHTHCALPTSQYAEVGAFLDKFLLGNTNANTSIATYPGTYTGIDYGRWYAWWGTGNPVFPQIYLHIPTEATEGDGTLVGQGSVSISSLTTTDIVVNLASSDTSEVTVPASVVIAAGQSNAFFDLTIIDDSLLDGDQVVAITANAPALNSAKGAYFTVHDNETATLSVTLPASASEAAGTLFNAGSVSIGTPVAADFNVSLASSDPSRLIVPANTIIASGQTSAVFNLAFVNNNIIEGSTNVGVTAHVPNWTDGSASMMILDDDLAAPFRFAWSPIPSPQLIGQPFHVTITAQDVSNNVVDYRFPVALSAWSASRVAGANTLLNSPTPDVTFAGGGFDITLGYSFTPTTNLVATHVRHYFGDKVSIWTDSGGLLASRNVQSVAGTWVDTALPSPVLLLAGATYRLGVHFSNTNFYWSWNLPSEFANGTIDACWSGSGDGFPNQPDDPQWYFVDLRYSTDVQPVSLNPVQTPNFISGMWSGEVSVLQAATDVLLEASEEAGHSGQSLPLDVLGTPKLAIAALDNSVVLSWPAAAAGFNLEQASNLLDWIPVPVTPAIVGDRWNVTNGLEADHFYFRLHKP
jgi:hypothetical protein